MRCPGCRLPLLCAEVEGIELDYCAADLGVWFDEGEIEALLQTSMPTVPATKAATGRRRCPRCDRRLLVEEVAPGLELDLCPAGDGIWFDAGEVTRLAAAIKSHGANDGAARLEKIFTHVARVIG
ncbi:MAG: zf-TFIIB domain-containing protein [Deltaproteobacteria bacterium]|nr:zf-TFIIB domain-containing protein [Deltaproteobacteria bacterium]